MTARLEFVRLDKAGLPTPFAKAARMLAIKGGAYLPAEQFGVGQAARFNEDLDRSWTCSGRGKARTGSRCPRSECLTEKEVR